ncbi:MAG: MOSC domain-containing protein [Acetobacteraceae bacterium]|nr:MOSC domain-containing protein [Acetobacteraceae bacterium]
MDHRNEYIAGTVAMLRRYPVKSMLGETCRALVATARGLAGDRAWAVLDGTTGKVASAKRPKLWGGLLACAARTLDEESQSSSAGVPVEITLPDGTKHRAGDPDLDRRLSTLIGRAVQLASVPPDEAELDRSHPEALLAEGLDEDVASDILKLGAGAPPGTFFDYAPLHLVTTATLNGLSAALSDGAVEPARYRANIVIRSPASTPDFPENRWVGGTVRIGDTTVLRIILQTPRCAIPMLAHGRLPPRPGVVRAAAERNRIEIPGFGNQPCAGAYAEVLREGTVREGDPVVFSPA